MKRAYLPLLVIVLTLSPFAHAQEGVTTAVLYAPNKYGLEYDKTLYSFKTGTYVRNLNLWDVNYGSLYVGDEWDWFSSSTAPRARTVIRDLGVFGWGDYFEVPVVEPFPKLKVGQMRSFTVDSSGADAGAPAPGKERRTGVPQVDPVYVKALPSHMYVMRVVDDDTDFYVLFRVEKIERGDNCTITWKRIAPPEEATK